MATKQATKKKDEEFLADGIKTEDVLKTNEEKEQADDIQDYVTTRMSEVMKMLEIRDQGFEFFGLNDWGEKLTLTNYIAESERRFNSVVHRDEYKDDWQANVFDPVTRNKTMAILARLAAQRMKAEFFNQQGISSDLALIIGNIYDASSRGKNGKGKDEKLLFDCMFEAILKGTVVRETLWMDGKRMIKTKKDKNGKWKRKAIYEFEDVFDRVIPLECFIPGDITKHNIQEMGRCATDQSYDLETFKIEYADFNDIHLVEPVKEMSGTLRAKFGLTKYTENEVRVTRYWNRNTDSYDVIANGILLTEMDNPLPYQHKQIPLQASRYEYMSLQFFYGMSLPFKLASFQDMSNALWNLTLDNMFISLKAPIFNASNSDFDMDWYYPSAVIDLEPGTNLDSIREFKVTPQTNYSSGLMNQMKQGMNEASGQGHEQSGAAGVGRGRTAEEVATAREAALEVMGLFLRQMEWFEEDRAEQKMQIILEFYPKRKKSDGLHRKLVIEQVQLLNRELGKMEVNFRNEVRPKELLNKLNQETDSTSQIVDITPREIRQFKGWMRIVPGSSLKETKQQEKENEIAWQKLTNENPMINQEESIKDLARVYQKNIDKILVPNPKRTGAFAELLNKEGGGGANNNLDNNNLTRAVSQADQLPKRGQNDV